MVNLIQKGGNEMAKVIEAVFEDGVFKPTQKIRLKDKQRVQIKILSDDDWQKRFDRVIKSIHKKTALFTPEEIEKDIEEAIKEVRKSKRAEGECSLASIIDIAKDCSYADLSVHHDKYLYGETV
jgi:predicted DNA-binding antitoxin AbrB/MazE fold protein